MRGALGVALVTLTLAGRAHAFVQRVDLDSPGKVKVAWRKSCIPVTIYLDGFETSPNKQNLPLEAIVKSVVAAAHAWSSDAVTCPSGGGPFIEIVPTLAPQGAKPPAVGYDAKNSIIFRNSPNDWHFDDAALAHTSPTWSAADGHLLDVDIEINATNPLQIWTNLDEGAPLPTPPSGHVADGITFYDLQAALTHEFGHFIGLMHACYRAEDGPQLTEQDGVTPVPECTPSGDLPSDVPPSVMAPVVSTDSTEDRTLTADDINAACTIYDPANLHDACELDTPPQGCSVAPPPRSSRAGLAAFAALAGLAALTALARRRARVSARGRARS